MKFRKKPVEIEAIQWDGENTDEVLAFCDNPNVEQHGTDETPLLLIPTLERPISASVGDWIIRGVKGELYPCKPDIFEMTYDPVDG